MDKEVLTETDYLQKAISLCGGQAPLGRKIDVRQGQVWNWLNRDKKIPSDKAIAIELATDGQVTREQLCPDTFCDKRIAKKFGI